MGETSRCGLVISLRGKIAVCVGACLCIFPIEQSKERCQVGSLAGAAHLLNCNAGVLRRAQIGGKPVVEQKGKSSFDC